MSVALVGALAVLAACVSVFPAPELKRHHRTAEIVNPENEPVGADECLTCHDEVQDRLPIPTYHEDCEACHGPGSVHAESEEPADIRFPASLECLTCHESGRATHLAWATGEHERAGVICSDCHNPHNREPLHVRKVRRMVSGRLDDTSTLCVECHVDVASRLTFPSHHPVREGMLSCTDCHAPHGDRRTALGWSTQLCGECHQDHAGPWIFEHLPTAEECTTCHNPHGTAANDLLDTNQPALCLSCHTVPTSLHAPGAGAVYYTRCTDCHSAIHGSYQDRRLRR